MKYGQEFDVSGLSCPLLIIKTKNPLADMASSEPDVCRFI
jgi:TusA-related sulfurtransferase